MEQQRSEAIARIVGEFWEAKGYGPTIREIGSKMGWRSTSTTHYHLDTAERLGFIVKSLGHSRSTRIPGIVSMAEHERCLRELSRVEQELAAAKEELLDRQASEHMETRIPQ